MNLVSKGINKLQALMFLLCLAFVTSPAFAQTASDFDGTDIITKVVTYTAVGVSILAAFALGRWTLRALGLIGGK